MASYVHAHVGPVWPCRALQGISGFPDYIAIPHKTEFLMLAGSICQPVYLALAQRKSIRATPLRIDAFHSDECQVIADPGYCRHQPPYFSYNNNNIIGFLQTSSAVSLKFLNNLALYFGGQLDESLILLHL
jgi:hypothetical protein